MGLEDPAAAVQLPVEEAGGSGLFALLLLALLCVAWWRQLRLECVLVDVCGRKRHAMLRCASMWVCLRVDVVQVHRNATNRAVECGLPTKWRAIKKRHRGGIGVCSTVAGCCGDLFGFCAVVRVQSQLSSSL